jgi:hypothetical protein
METNNMPQTYANADLESRIVELEDRFRKQEKKIRLLGTLASMSHASPFDSPLQQFFDDADKFWTDVFEDNAACHNRCTAALAQDVSNCNGDEACIKAAYKRARACHAECGDLS